ncbi:caprin-1-like isoform X2 [Ornithodoros turicata]|uniref:caprin-1-like isoform X2 n=1 Tax=Ornithodoros turicata TaxID=34597 RepID=UPI0031388F44
MRNRPSLMRNMPSAAAKIEKQTSLEAPDSFKSILVIFEKKTRNLEKRKGRLDHLRSELDQGKELNDDQKAAVLKYDQVVEALEFTRDLQKAITGIMQEHVRACKKAAKREAAERTSRDTQRIREVLQLQDLLTTLGTPEARQCFLDGTSGAVQLQPHDLELMDELYRLVSPESQEGVGQAAEHLTALLDRKNKEVLGTTYKALRELLQSIEECAYFSGTQGVTTTEEQSERSTEQEVSEPVPEETCDVPQELEPAAVPEESVETVQEVSTTFCLEPREEEPESNNLHFFQESQIDVEAPPAEPVQPAFVAPEFDPSHPIPTQTFTNQSFAPPDRRGGRARPKGYSNGRGGGGRGGRGMPRRGATYAK